MNTGDAGSPSRLEQIIELLNKEGIEFLVVEGGAEALYGSQRPTYDVDPCYRQWEANLERLAASLRQLKPTLRNAPPDLPFRIDKASPALGGSLTFSRPLETSICSDGSSLSGRTGNSRHARR